jgi:hypothetical protein
MPREKIKFISIPVLKYSCVFAAFVFFSFQKASALSPLQPPHILI